MKFSEWLVENESSDKNQKIAEDIEKWGKSLSGANEVSISKFYGNQITIYFKTNYGCWMLSLEAAHKKKGIDSYSFNQTYSKDENNLKWYMSWPSAYNRYNHRSDKKLISIKTFKTIFEKVMTIYEIFDKAVEFSELLNKDVEQWKNGRCTFKTNSDFSVELQLSNGKIGYAHGDSTILGVSNWVVFWKDDTNQGYRETLDLSTGDFYLKLLNTINPTNENVKAILEVLKDKPADKEWEIIKSGDWMHLSHELRGALTSKKYNL